MKRTYYRLGFCVLMLSFFAACVQKETSSNTSQSNNPISTGETSAGSTSGSTAGSTSGTTGGSTTGSTSGSTAGATSGSTGGTPANVFKFNVMMSGKINSALPAWYPGFYPGDYSSSVHGGDFYQLSSQNIAVFQSDNRFKARVKVLSEPVVGGVANAPKRCYNRTSGGGDSSTFPYTKLKMEVGIRNVYSNYTVGNAYGHKSVEVGVNNYSNVLDWGSNQFFGRESGANIIGHVVEIRNVYSDAWCRQSPDWYCPFFDHPSNRCWNVELELATDLTQDF